MSEQIDEKTKAKLEEIMRLEKEDKLEYISFEESKKRSLEYLEKLAKNQHKKASGEWKLFFLIIFKMLMLSCVIFLCVLFMIFVLLNGKIQIKIKEIGRL